MRDFNENDTVSAMTLEHYPAMTTRYLDKLEQQAKQQWPALLDCLIIHRVGEIHPADPIVLIACWSAHRRAALDATSWLIEELKNQAPFWKKRNTNHWHHMGRIQHGWPLVINDS
jgi:molybdopterin synthase catalytic subunit